MHAPNTLPAHNRQQEEAAMNMIKNMESEAGSLNDAFDGSAEPIIYMSDNRMPVMIEFNSTIIYVVFAALVLALLFIIPGVRKTRFTSLVGLLTLLTVGASILLAIEGSYWLTGSIQIYEAAYSALTRDTITGRLEINIGLSSANVTLNGRLTSEEGLDVKEENKVVDYNERFLWEQPEKMASEHTQALRRGLPYPILTVTEYLSQDADGFNWTRQLRQAGFYSSFALYAALASWGLMTVVMCVLPVYLPHMMQITGSLMMSSVWIYTLLIQSPKSFAFQVGGNPIEIAFGYTYVATFLTGALSMFAGVLLFALQISNPHKQFTIMDSERYVQDHKALYENDVIKNEDMKPDIVVKKRSNDGRSLTRTDSVIIPIADIEKNFNHVTA